jgi:transcriptional regulator with XRE-family HTH domain
MSPAELRTAHDSLGVSAKFLADRIGCHVNMVWRWESPERTSEVPSYAEDVVRDLLNDFDLAAEELANEVRRSESGAIPRYSTLEAFEAAIPALAGWGVFTIGQLTAEVARRLPATTRIEYR